MKTSTNSNFIRRFLLIPLVALASATSGNAALLSAVAVFSDMGVAAPQVTLENTINGSGLSSVSLTGTHTLAGPQNSWASANGTTLGEITFDLGDIQTINGFSFWNLNDGGPELDGVNGIEKVSISSSIDGKDYFPIVGAPTSFAQETGETSSAQQFFFAPVNASFVRYTVLSNHGDPTNTGFAETQFRTASVPDAGSTLALLGITLLGLGVLKRKYSD